MRDHLVLSIVIGFCAIISCQKKEIELSEIQQLAIRVLGEEQAKSVVFKKNKSVGATDRFKIDVVDGTIQIEGNTNVALASGLNWYLKYKANSHLSWEATRLDFPETISALESPITKESLFEYSYYLNYCTYNYSMAFWDWERWEKEIDWMAMNGINLPLVMVGTEIVWQNTLERLGYSPEEIKKFIPGPAYGAWWLMGNLEGMGGPVSEAYIQQQYELQKKILARMKSLDIRPVFPGFYGMVPNTLKDKFPVADIRDQGTWGGGFTRPAFLPPSDTLFQRVSSIYYDEVKKHYGHFSYFSGDPFHEGGSTEGIDLKQAGRDMISAVQDHFPEAIWVFQGWQGNPNEGLLEGIDDDNVLILDLDCDSRPQWIWRNGWNGKPWIWNSVTNFGGNTGLFGRLDVLASEPFNALNQHPNCRGIGAIMEGIENNSVIYELLFELKWHHQPVDIDDWLQDYVERRYGEPSPNLTKAWQILRNTVYSRNLDTEDPQQGTSEAIVCARPSLDLRSVSTWGTSKLYYQPSELLTAWKFFIEESRTFQHNEGFQYDLVNLTRQVLSNYAQSLYQKIIKAYQDKDEQSLRSNSEEFLQLITDLDMLLSSHDQFMVSKWINDARDLGTSDQEKDLFEYNARRQITVWSFDDSMLHEYAHKEWSGLLEDFYKPRWEMFIAYLEQKLKGIDFPEPDYYGFEDQWSKQRNAYPSEPTRSPVEESERIFSTYYDKINNE